MLLDIDGTLVLSNEAHAHAWEEAFAGYGYETDFDELVHLIGVGGDKLMSGLFHDLDPDEGVGKEIDELRSEIFKEKYAKNLAPAPGSRELLIALKEREIVPVIASSAKGDELELLLKGAQVEDLVDTAATSDDAENSKPDPDIIQASVRKTGFTPSEALMVGDTPYDIRSANAAHVPAVALRTGGWDDYDLHGAIAVFDDPADLCHHLDEVISGMQVAIH